MAESSENVGRLTNSYLVTRLRTFAYVKLMHKSIFSQTFIFLLSIIKYQLLSPLIIELDPQETREKIGVLLYQLGKIQ